MPTLLNPTTDEARVYEIAVLLPSDLSDKEKQETLKNIDALLNEHGMKVLHKDEWKKMGLAYPIKGKTHGQYILFYAEGNPSGIADIDRQLKIERGVLRHLTIKLPPKYELVNWEDHYHAWKDGLVKEEEEKKKEREEALKKKIVQRALRQEAAPAKKAARPEEAATEPGAGKAPELSEKELAEKLGELISDENLNL